MNTIQQSHEIRLHFPASFDDTDCKFIFENIPAYSRTVVTALIDAMYQKTMDYRNSARKNHDQTWLQAETERLTYLGELQRKLRNDGF